jgi:hypothetical protein
MTFRPRFALCWIAFVGVAAWMAAGRTTADEPAKDGKKDRSVLEQDIYIPYEKLRQVFEKQGRGVFLPYDKFQELWQAAQEKTRPTAEVKPPVGALITEISNEATVEKDVVRVKAKLQIEVLAEGWNEIPLRLSDAAITTATLAGKPARIVGTPGQDYRLLIEKKSKEPEQFELSLEYAKAISRTPGKNSVSFQTPQAPVSRWRVTIPQGGVKVNLQPLIAASEEPTAKAADETVVLAFVGAAPTVGIDWTPKAEGATGMTAMASVQAEQQFWITEGVARTLTTLNYAISRAELAQLTIDVPADQKIVNVFDANVRQWSVETVEGRQRITAQLFEPAKSAQQVTVELEKLTGDKAKETIDVPAVRASGVGQQRQQGLVVVRVADGLRAEPSKTSGLLQVDSGELPSALAREKWAFAYRYATTDYQLALNVEKLQPEITVDSLVEAFCEPERLSLNLAAIYTIEKAGVFRLELDIPAGYEVQKVRGEALAGAAAVQVDGFHLEGADWKPGDKPIWAPPSRRLVVNLGRKAMGRVALAVQLQKDLNRPELLTPTGKAIDLATAVPLVVRDTVQRATGRLVVYAPESLRVNPGKNVGLRSISFQEAFDAMQSSRPQKPTGVRPVLAFAFAQGPVELALAAERRKPQVTVRQLLVARVEEGVVKYQITLFYNVLYSGVKSLRVDVPADVAAGLRVTTPGVHERAIEPPPAGLAKKYIAWSLTGESELMGDGKIELTCEKKIEKLGIGKSVELTLPCLKPQEVDRAWGQIALVKSETIDVYEAAEPKSLRPIDPQHDLMTPVASAARAFEFHDDWTLAVAATRYQLEEVKRTSIERAVVRMVVTPANVISVQAIYRMRSVQQRLPVVLPEGATFDAQPLRVNGRPAALEKGERDEYFVPLVGTTADTPFVLELRYTLSGDGSRLDLPSFPQEPAAVKAYLCVYLPETRSLLGVRGPWTEEFRWYSSSFTRRQPAPKLNADQLVQWVQEGVKGANQPTQDFQTDGYCYLYSTLSPAPSPEGSLETTTIDRRGLNAIVFIGTILLGLVLLPARGSIRVLVIGAAVVAMVLSGVFLPTFSVQILDGVLFLAVFIVAMVWFTLYVVQQWNRWMPVVPPSSPSLPSSPPATPAVPAEPEAPTEPAVPTEAANSPAEGGASHG